jgi:UDP-N-acetylglucosamine 2-epimerase (non-hydrolysing)
VSSVHTAAVVGARPNFVKVAPVVHELRRRGEQVTVIHTGQHYSPQMADVFFDELGLRPDVTLAVGSGSHGAQTASALEGVERVLMDLRPDTVLVPGDVNSTLAAALAAVKLGIRVVHLEAGLRSFDRTMPEEINRVLVDHCSDLLLTTCGGANVNLLAEGLMGRWVGNTMIDSLAAVEPDYTVLDRLGIGEPYLLATLHRPALVDNPLLLEWVLTMLAALPYRVVFPVHPRTRVTRWSGILFCEPLSYREFVAVETRAAGVITDSGGVQEETSWLGVPCFTLRENTERAVTVTDGTNTLLGLDPGRIAEIPALMEAPKTGSQVWDGKAAPRVCDVMGGLV